MPKRKTKKQRRDRYASLMVPMALALPVVVMNEQYGWGAKKRAPELAEHLLQALQKIESGETAVGELLDRFEELTGLHIE